MARINIESSLFKDNRFLKLIIKLGDNEKAVGALVMAWMLGQEWYLTPEKMVPLSEWKKQGINEAIIEVGLAEVIDGKVKISGSEKQFSWLKQKSNAGQRGGLASGKARREIIDKSAKRDEAGRSGANLPFSFLLSPSSSLNSPSSNLSTQKQEAWGSKKQPPTQPSLGSRIWDAYADEYQHRHGVTPVRNKMINGQMGHLAARLGENAIDVVRFYVRHNNAFYLRTSHAVGPLLKDAESLHTEWMTGNQMLGTRAREVERMQHNRDSFDLAWESIQQEQQKEKLNAKSNSDDQSDG